MVGKRGPRVRKVDAEGSIGLRLPDRLQIITVHR